MKLLILFASFFIGVSSGDSDELKTYVIKIPSLGRVRGTIGYTEWNGRKMKQFKGIRYAKSPSGRLRFQPPEPEEPWYDIYDATEFKQRCPQFIEDYQPKNHSHHRDEEDCLTLNVFMPFRFPDRDTGLYPVMVFIHGGAFTTGYADIFKPDYLLEQDVVLVTIQYRLGPLGFLSLQTDEIPGNVGLMDQLEALRWVHKHIKNFGGDNQLVTVFGQSAGAASISYLLLSPIVESNLFQKVIIHSGSAYAKWGIDYNPLKAAKGIYRQLTNDNDFASNLTMAETFKKATVSQLIAAALKNKDNMINGAASRPVIQKAGKVKYFEKSPIEHFNDGDLRTLPMIAGVTKNEGTLWAARFYEKLVSRGLENNYSYLRNHLVSEILQKDMMEINEDTNTIAEILSNNLFKDIFDRTVKLTFKDLEPGVSDIFSIFMFKGQVLKQAKANALHSDLTYLYSFEYRGEKSWGYKIPFDSGVAHTDDLIYLFPLFELDERDTRMAKIMTELWVSFARNSMPISFPLIDYWIPLAKYENGPFLHISSCPHLGPDFADSEFMVSVSEEIDLKNSSSPS